MGRDPAGHSISVKLSALHPRYEVAQYDRCVPELAEMLAQLASEAARRNVALTVDAEESERLEMSLDIIGAVAGRSELEGWGGFGMAVQAYGKRARAVIGWADALGRPMHVRLVKGAYWDSEIKRTQVEGLSDYPLFTRKAATDISYLACARDMLAARNIVPAFASHNALTVATILEWAGDARDFEFQRLHGMGEGLYERLVREEGYHCRIYAPVGGHRDLLAYLVRRLLENGANSSFVHQLADEHLSEAELLADPVEKIAAVSGSRHPSIPLPVDLFGEWRNSGGIDLQERGVLAETAAAIAASPPPASGRGLGGGAPVSAPASPEESGGPPPSPSRSREGKVSAAISRAQSAFPAWAARTIDDRAHILERLADSLEANRTELMALAVKEAFKTIPDALGEVREAADFCRYYAARARADLAPVTLPGPTGERNELRMEGRGVWATIAPWNFPLAIFLGQTAAALAAGNTVVAKPAPQTPEIARAAVRLAHAAGVPEDALILLPGGPETGAALVGDPRIAGVAFTGSTPTARRIARTLLEDETRPLVPLIAETGGINAMIVDSTALPEQVVADVLTLRLPLGRPALLGAAAAGASGGDRRRGARDAARRDGAAGDRRSGRSRHRCRAGDRPAGLRQADGVSRFGSRALAQDAAGARRGFVRAPDADPARPDRGSRSRMVRPDPPRRDLARRHARRDDRAGERQGLRADDGAPQPHRAIGRTRRGARAGGQSLRQSIDDRRGGGIAAVRRRRPVGDRTQGGRAALSPALLRRAFGVGRHDQRGRQRDAAEP